MLAWVLNVIWGLLKKNCRHRIMQCPYQDIRRIVHNENKTGAVWCKILIIF